MSDGEQIYGGEESLKEWKVDLGAGAGQRAFFGHVMIIDDGQLLFHTRFVNSRSVEALVPFVSRVTGAIMPHHWKWVEEVMRRPSSSL